MMTFMANIYTIMRRAIAASKKSRYQISMETDIGAPHLCDFMKGIKGLSVEALERLADSLDLEITAQPLQPRKTKKSRRKEV